MAQPTWLAKLYMSLAQLSPSLLNKENLVSKEPPLMFSPKRKLTLDKLDISSPSERNKFQDTRQFWKTLQGDTNLKKINPGIKFTSLVVTELASGSETKSIN